VRNAYKILGRKFVGHLEDQGVDWRIMLKWIFKTLCVD